MKTIKIGEWVFNVGSEKVHHTMMRFTKSGNIILSINRHKSTCQTKGGLNFHKLNQFLKKANPGKELIYMEEFDFEEFEYLLAQNDPDVEIEILDEGANYVSREEMWIYVESYSDGNYQDYDHFESEFCQIEKRECAKYSDQYKSREPIHI